MDDIGLGSIRNDLIVNIFLISIVLLFSIFILIKKKNIILGVFLFSLLSNFILFISSTSLIFDIYNLKWIIIFTLNYWPLINIFLFILLIINFIKNKKNEKNKHS